MRCFKEQHGFLMIEVLIATAVISVALVAAAGMLIQSTQATAQAAQYTAATSLAQGKLEKIKAGVATPAHETIPQNGTEYTVDWVETVWPDDDRLYSETVTVTWQERGQTQSIEMVTYVVGEDIAQFP
jgi:prepilin-type N-terminal cleavage/methylation domain-containing protein